MSKDENLRGTTRMMLGFIFLFSAVFGFATGEIQGFMVNLLFFVIGVCLTVWGHLVSKENESV